VSATPPPANFSDDENWRPQIIESLRNCGLEREHHNPGKRFLLILGAMGVSIAAAIISQALQSGLEDVPAGIALAAWLVYLAGAVFIVARLRNRWIRESWQLKARTAEEELARPGAKRPVFYLRSFNLDERVGKPSVFERFLGTVPLANSEQKLTRELHKLGPVIAIGRPGEKLPALGAARFYVSEDLWHQKVGDVVKVSQLVLWATGITPGLRWEIGHLIENLPPEKLVLWAHPHLMHMTAPEREEEWAKFRAALGDIFPKPLPETLGETRFICFAPDWTPIPIAPRWSGPFRAMGSFFDPMSSALSEVRKIKQGKLDANTVAYRGEARGGYEADLGTLIGVTGPKIIWQRVIALFAALCVSWNCIFLGGAFAGMFSRAIRGDFENYSGILAWQMHEYFGREFSIANFEMPVLLGVCMCVAFRYLRNWKSAALATSAGFLVVFELIEQLSGHGNFYFAGALSTFVFQLGFVGGLAYAVPRFKPVAKGIFVGAFFGDVAAWAAMLLLGEILSLRLVELYAPIQYVFDEAIFAFVFWLILRAGGRAKS
jgi:hypothetical protein